MSGSWLPAWTVPPELRRHYRDAGWWDGRTLVDVAVQGFGGSPRSVVRTHSATRPSCLTYAEVLDGGRALAAHLESVGVRQGDAVAFQLPNWSEALVCFVGALLRGAVLVPIAPYYREHELTGILRRSEARCLIVAEQVRGRRPIDEVAGLRDQLPALGEVIVVGDGPTPSWATPYAGAVGHAKRAGDLPRIDPAAPAAVTWTSGTTAEPKGVVLSHQALAFEVRFHMAPSLPSGARLAAAPLSHVTGMLATALVPPVRGEDIHLLDVWSPAAVVALMDELKLPPALYAPVFATSLLDEPSLRPDHLRLMDTASLGGAPVPRALAERLERAGVAVTRGYGCTEHPSISLSASSDGSRARLTTDGRILPGVELRLLDDDGAIVAVGAQGEIHSRGPDLFSGYLGAAGSATNEDGYFATGDIGVVEEDESGRWLRLVDRKKDIVIRAGINISAAEVEAALDGLPGVRELSVIGVPDARTGERVCVAVVPVAGREVTLEDVRRHLDAARVARQKWPESVLLVDEALPRTPSGKVRKPDLCLQWSRRPGDHVGD